MLSKAGSYVCACDRVMWLLYMINVSGDLISGYMITGVKLARTVYRLLYGTREVNIAL